MSRTTKYFIAAGICLVWALALPSGCNDGYAAYSQKPSKADTIPPQKNYTITYDRGFLNVHLDSLLRYGSQFIGSELSKQNYFEVMAIYNRIIVRIATTGKLDSTIIKQK
jgi:hypothetical protein